MSSSRVPQPNSDRSSSSSAALPIQSSDKTILAKKGYICKSEVGSGSYSKVKVAVRIRSQSTEKYAFKIIDRSKAPADFQQKFLPRELEIWPKLKHPNIIRMYSYFEHEPKIYMLLEYAQGGDVLDYVQKSGALTQRQARTWIKQIVDAVCYLHKLGIAHRDLKLENILIDDKENVKICDFGFAKMDIRKPSSTFCGSKAYAAPEILAGLEYSPTKADIWAIGVILYIFVTGTMPFNEEYKNRVILEQQQNLAFQWRNFCGVTPECKSLILSMFTYDFVKRPEILTIVRDPWFHIEKPVRPNFSARPKSRASGGATDNRDGGDSARPSLSVESGVQTSPRMPPRQSFAGHFSQKPRMKPQSAEPTHHNQPQHQQRQHRDGAEDGFRGSGGGGRGGGAAPSSSRVPYNYGGAGYRADERRLSGGYGVACSGRGSNGLDGVAGSGRNLNGVDSITGERRELHGVDSTASSGRGSNGVDGIASGRRGLHGVDSAASSGRGLNGVSSAAGSGRGSNGANFSRPIPNGETPSPLAEPPRPKRIWLNGGVPAHSGNRDGVNSGGNGYPNHVERNHRHDPDDAVEDRLSESSYQLRHRRT